MEHGENGSERREENLLRENITAAEYQQAVETLQGFAGKDLSGVTTLETLADATVDVGSALRAVILSRGAVLPEKTTRHTPTEEEVVTGEPVVTFRIEGGGARFAAKTSEKSVSLRTWDGPTSWTSKDTEALARISVKPNALDNEATTSEGEYEVSVPARRLDIASGSLFDIAVRAQESKGGQWIQTEPRKHPTNTQVQRNYARLLQTGVRDVLSLKLPPLSEVPAAFYE